MAKAYIISYELRSQEKDYSQFYNSIKALGEWVHPIESSWIVVTDASEISANDIYMEIKPYLNNDDMLIVVEITDMDRQGWMPTNLWNLLKQHSV